MKNFKKTRGITLIALIITIIVMLILVSVTISMAVNGGLFNYAQKAVGETKNAIEKEQALGGGGLNIAGTWYNSIDEYITPGKTEKVNWEVLLADANSNPNKYLQEAAKIGQDIEKNTAIGIGTNGKVVNMDLWIFNTTRAVNDYVTPSYGNGYALTAGSSSEGMWYGFGPAYLGSDFNNIIVPQYIKTTTDTEFVAVNYMGYTFSGYTNLITAPKIPDTVKILDETFSGCSNLTQAPEIPEGVIQMLSCFSGCTSLEGTVKISSKNIIDGDIFEGTTKDIVVKVPANSTTYNAFTQLGEAQANIKIETF